MALVYPRTPEAIVLDNGKSKYAFRTPPLSNGIYDFNVLQINDRGITQTAIVAPADSPLTIHAPPAAPTITGVTLVAGAFVIAWDLGEAGNTYTVYYSDRDKPINFGQQTGPAPVATAVDATSATLGLAPSTTPIDLSADYAAAAAAFDAVAAAFNTAFAAGEATFTAALPVQISAAFVALKTFEKALGKPLNVFRLAMISWCNLIESALATVAGLGLSTADWQTAVRDVYSGLVATLGALVDGSAQRYSMPDGSLPGELPGELMSNLYDAAQPFVRPARFRFVVRARDAAGVEELNESVFTLEVDGAGVADATRPNPASIQSIDCAGLTATVTALVIEDNNAGVLAVSVNLLVNGVVVANAVLPAATDGTHEVAIDYIFAAPGWYSVAVQAVAVGTGAVSDASVPQDVYASDAAPVGVAALEAQVMRGLDVGDDF